MLVSPRKPAARICLSLLAALCCFAVSILPSTAVAQSSTTGAISGTITDANGALLPATVVVVTSVETGTVRKIKSNGKGEFRVSELEPGTYNITFTADGFEVTEQDAVKVLVGQVSNLSPKLKIGSVSDKVEVQASQGDLHLQSNDISTTIDQNAIDNLPINGRRFSNFALLTPGVVSNADGFGLLSFRGISFLLNNNTVDGADDNQAYFSEARGRTRTSYAITQAAVQEFQVNTSNYSAEYGRAAGGVINTVTKSGGNQFHGELFFYDRDNAIGGAVNPYTLLTVPAAGGTYNTIPYKPTDRRLQYGFGIGGPIIRDKLFWFYAYDQSHRNFPGTARAPDPNETFAPADALLPAGSTCSATSFSSTALNLATEGDYNACAIASAYGTTYQAGAAYYTQGLGILSSYLGTVPRVQDQVINLPKIDYQISDRERLSMLYNRLRSSSPNGVQTQASNTYGIASFGDDFVKEDFGITRLTSVLSTSVVNEALVQYGRDFEYEYSDAPSPNELPLSNNSFGRPAQVGIAYEFDQGFTIGKSENLDRDALPDERRLQLLDGVTWSHGTHTTKVGLDYNKVSDFTNNLYDGNGNYSYDYGYDYIADYLHATTGIGPSSYVPLYYSYGQGFGNPIGEITTREYAGYANDDWRITPRLTLTLGIRYEYEYVPPNPFPNTGNPALVAAFAGTVLAPGIGTAAIPLTTSRPDDRNNVGPRIGFALNVFGDGKTTLRGGYGIYYGRIINSNILQTYLESGAPNAQVNFNSSNGNTASLYQTGHCGPTFPAIINAASDVYNCFAGKTSPLGTLTAAPQTPTSTVAYLDPHLQNPQVHEVDLAVEQDLGHGFVLGVSYLGSFARELDHAVDTNFSPSATYNYTFTVATPPTTSTNVYPVHSTYTPSYGAYPQPPVQGYVTYPHGGAALPLRNGQQFTTKVFLQPLGLAANTRPNIAYGQILDVRSDVNSSYSALAVQLNRRFTSGFSLLANYTWSHALDYNPYQSTVVPTYNEYDPTNLHADYGNSNNDVRQRFVFASVYQPQTHFTGYKSALLGGWRISPIVQVQTGLPYTPFVSGSVTGLTVPNGVDGCTLATCAVNPAYKGLNGSGSSADRIPAYERNTYNFPRTAVVDLRLGKNFYSKLPYLGDRVRFEVFGEVFNVLNHQNITGINTNAYSISTTTPLTINPYSQQAGNGFGTYTNSDSNTTYSQRQVQLAARVHF